MWAIVQVCSQKESVPTIGRGFRLYPPPSMLGGTTSEVVRRIHIRKGIEGYDSHLYCGVN